MENNGDGLSRQNNPKMNRISQFHFGRSQGEQDGGFDDVPYYDRELSGAEVNICTVPAMEICHSSTAIGSIKKLEWILTGYVWYH